ncbi:hypothetical protein [Xanthomonas bonasiae]|uniref:hypothetical protein n=1 Tax=Xanthomonas bonasiae TaxID=2810351 RepID=UPI0019818110|nr:hypothetical protein [Xanthomonas bonasiae]MBN6110239.1 hypothetical protein [Xanthomonas bonasiae]
MHLRALLAAVLAVPSSVAAAQDTLASAAQPLLTQVAFAGGDMQLGERGGHCALLRGETELLALAIPAPCGFSPDRHGKVRIEPFNRGSRIVLVEYIRPDPRPPLRGSARPECIREAQAVRAIGGTLEAGHVIASAGCDRGPTDQKLFVAGFAW